MPQIGPIRRADLVRNLRRLGFSGPLPGGSHQYMVREHLKVWIPNPHQGDISVGLLNRILKQSGVSREEWEQL
jgi:predicted RNA binding protein YcfA (HicA-like mRNA interferase family)